MLVSSCIYFLYVSENYINVLGVSLNLSSVHHPHNGGAIVSDLEIGRADVCVCVS
jgi:hypothetical protein